MNSKLQQIILYVFLILPFSVLGNQVTEISLKDKVHQSKIIFIGKVISKNVTKLAKGNSAGIALIKITTEIKGVNFNKNIKFLYDGLVVECNGQVFCK